MLEKSLREVKQIISDAVANALLEYSKEELRIMKNNKEVITIIEERDFNTFTPKRKFGFCYKTALQDRASLNKKNNGARHGTRNDRPARNIWPRLIP